MLANGLAAARPDIVALQEVTPDGSPTGVGELLGEDWHLVDEVDRVQASDHYGVLVELALPRIPPGSTDRLDR